MEKIQVKHWGTLLSREEPDLRWSEPVGPASGTHELEIETALLPHIPQTFLFEICILEENVKCYNL